MKIDQQRDKDVLPESATTLSKVIIAASASLLSADPIIGAGAATSLTETFFGIRGRLKLKRTENFIVEFSKYIREVKSDFDIETVDSTDFGDFFEQVLIKVSQTNSKRRLVGFKKLVANQILKPVSYDLAHKYLELASNLNENHLIIIRHWYTDEQRYKEILKQFDLERNRLRENYDKGLDKMSSQETYSEYQTRLLNYEAIDKENFREIIKGKRKSLQESFEEDEFDFWNHDLRKLGVFEHDTRSNSYKGDRSFEYLYLSPFGRRAISYILN